MNLSSSQPILSRATKELRQLIRKAGLSDADCIEKSDLQKRAVEAQERLAQAQANPSHGPGASTSGPGSKKFSSYDCKVVHTKDPGAEIDGVLIILHGYGVSCCYSVWL